MKRVLKGKKWLPISFLLLILLVTYFSKAESPQHETRDNSAPANTNVSTVTAVNPSNGVIEPIETLAAEPDIAWFADMETGNLSQWSENGEQTSWDSGKCYRSQSGVTTEHAHSGDYSMKLAANTRYRNIFAPNVRSGCRQFRYPEAKSNQPYYYSTWFYLPEKYQVPENNFAMLGQFKSKTNDKTKNDPVWSYQIQNNESGEMMLVLNWNGNMPGPFEDDPIHDQRIRFTQDSATLPVGEWFHLEVYLKPSTDFDGQLVVWQDGTELFNLTNIKTLYPDSFHTWSVTSYGSNTEPPLFTVYVDDAVISSERVGPTFSLRK